MDRRDFIKLTAAALAAPAIVKAANIMPVRNRILKPYPFTFSCYLKPQAGQKIAQGLTSVPLNNGWFRISHRMNAYNGETIPLFVPEGHDVYGVQLEWEGDGMLLTKKTTFELMDTSRRRIKLL